MPPVTGGQIDADEFHLLALLVKSQNLHHQCGLEE